MKGGTREPTGTGHPEDDGDCIVEDPKEELGRDATECDRFVVDPSD